MEIGVAELGLALAVGVGLGAWFFGGLLWTVRLLPTARHPVLLMSTGFVVRVAGVAAGLIWLFGRHWLLPVVALVGFVAVRAWMLRAWVNHGLKGPAE